MNVIIRLFWLLLIAILLLSAAGCGASPKINSPAAIHGSMDLLKWDFAENGIVPLGGEWAFYGHRLLEPDADWPAEQARFVMLPKTWNSYPSSYGFSSGKGFATYRLTVRVSAKERILSLMVPNIFTAYRLYVNGDLTAKAGMVSDTPEGSVPEQVPRVVNFENSNGRIDLVLQVSNYHHNRGGVWVNFELGTTQDIIKEQNNTISRRMILLGSLAIIGFYHIGLFVLRRQERFTLHFGLLCLLVALRIVVTGEGFLLRWLPLVTWEAAMKLEYISFALSILTGFLYVYHLFPKDVPGKSRLASVSISMLMVVFVCACPAYIYSKMLPVFQLYAVSVSLYAIYILMLARKRRREGASYVLLGIIIFMVAIINDILMYNEWARTIELVPVGLFFFMLMQAVIISRRFSHALRKVEDVSSELRELNAHLEERIEERTDALRGSKEILERTNGELEKLQNSRRHLLTNISHDLRTPMTLIQGYLEAMQDGVIQGPEQQGKYVRMMLGKVGGLNRLITDLFELSKLEAGQVPFDMREVRVCEWMANISDMFELDSKNRDIEFQCRFIQEDLSQEEFERLQVRIDEMRMNQVLENLVYNALNYTEAGGRITVTFRLDQADHNLILGIEDTGGGIHADDLPYIFDRFYKRDKSRSSSGGGSGIGLAIVKEIVELHHGSIAVESVPGKGTMFWISLKLSKQITGKREISE